MSELPVVRVYDVPVCGCPNAYTEDTGLHMEGCLLGLAGLPDTPELAGGRLVALHLPLVS
jgi:hypothetical protein